MTQEERIDEIKNSHTMKLIPQSQRELFWSEIEPKLQALISEAIEQYVHEDAPRIQGLISEARIEELNSLKTKKIKGSNLIGMGLVDKRLAQLRKNK